MTTKTTLPTEIECHEGHKWKPKSGDTLNCPVCAKAQTTPDQRIERAARAFYSAKVPDGRWEIIPNHVKEAYLNAIKAALETLEPA